MQLTPCFGGYFIKIVTSNHWILIMPNIVFISSPLWQPCPHFTDERNEVERGNSLFQVTLGGGDCRECSLDPLFSHLPLWALTDFSHCLECFSPLDFGESHFLFSFSSAQGRLDAFFLYPVSTIAHISPPSHSLTLYCIYLIELLTTENTIFLFVFCLPSLHPNDKYRLHVDC